MAEIYGRQESGCTDAWEDYRRRVDGALVSRDGSYVTVFEAATANDPTLYAPVPVAGQPPLLFSSSIDYSYPEYQPSAQNIAQEGYPNFQGIDAQTVALSASPSSSSSSISQSQYTSCEVPNAYHYQNDDGAPTQTFPTPSELLIEMGGNKSVDSARCSNKNLNDLPRRPRRRPANKSISFISGDPSVIFFLPNDHPSTARSHSETISSHEKKRHYLECLEHYVMYLHQQLKLVGAEPVPLERVQQYRGLSNRSMRVC